MRAELEATFDGTFPEVAKAQPIVLRIARRDNDGKIIACDCVDTLTGEPDRDTFCPTCFGDGFIWDEQLVDSYKVVIKSSVGLSSREDLIKPGLTNIPLISFYFRYDIPITFDKDITRDKVIEIALDQAGDPARPYKRDRVYRIGTAIDFRSDNGKLEYWKLDCYGEQVKFLNGPQG
jgi:hypothetical protein